MKEIWTEIEDFTDYQISNKGRVKSFRMKSSKKKGRILKPQISAQGKYFQVRLFNGEKKTGNLYYVHRLVAHHFIKPIQTDDHIHHLDENVENNKVNNIKIVTQSEHMKLHCLFTNDDIKEIRNDIISGNFKSNAELAKKWGTSDSLISLIKNNQRYRNIGKWKESKESGRGYNTFTLNQVKQIREDYKTLTITEIHKKWNRPYHSIWRIVNNKSFKDI